MISPKSFIALLLLFTMPLIARAELPVNVMTFNVRYGTANDGENSWQNRKDLAVRVVEEHGPDIIGTQETLDFQADYLCQHLPDYRWFGAPRTAMGTPERCAILYKWREFVPLETGTFWLSETPDVFGSQSWDARLPRVATWARFHHLASGARFYVYNTHFDHIGQQSRLNAMRVILDHIAENVADDAPVIITGDFNVIAQKNEVYDIIAGTEFRDAWLVATEQRGPVTTWNAFREPAEDADGRIDWIFARGPFEIDSCETITYREEGRYPSDHFPVMAKLRLKTSE